MTDNTQDVQATTINHGTPKYLTLNAELNNYDQNGKIQYDKDRQAARDYFLNHVNPNTYWAHSIEEKIRFLIENGYYEKETFTQYTPEFVKNLYKKVYAHKFRFQSFVGALKYYQSYALKTWDGKRYLERFEDRVAVTALYLAQGNEKQATNIAEEIITGRLQPATPTFLNSGKQARGDLVSCFPAGTLVDTDKGQKPIETLTTEDKVLTHTNQYKKVEKLTTIEYSDTLLEINIIGHETITVTKEHPFLVHSINPNDDRETIIENDGATTQLKWVKAQDLNPKTDYVVMAYNKDTRSPHIYNLIDYLPQEVYPEGYKGRKNESYTVENNQIVYYNREPKYSKNHSKISVRQKPVTATVQETEELGRFLGYYISEGYVSKRKTIKETLTPTAVIFTFGSHEEEYINDIINLGEELFNITPTLNYHVQQNCVKISFNSRILAEFILELLGTGFGEKKLTPQIETAPNDFLKGLLVGIYRGDGNTSTQSVQVSLVNPEIIHQLKLVATKLGLAPRTRYFLNAKGNKTGTLALSGGFDENDLFIHEIGKNLQNYRGAKNVRFGTKPFFLSVENQTLASIVSVTEEKNPYENTVYNLHVQDDHTYSVFGVIVHNCFLLNVEDNLNSIGRVWNNGAQLSKRGGGVAINLNNLRGNRDPIKGVHNAASGVVPVMKVLEDVFSYANQLGQRQGAAAVYLNAHHIDIQQFLDTKRENADEKIRIKTLSLGVVIPDITFELAKKGEPMYLFSPHDVAKEYGKEFSWISVSEIYRDAVDNPRIRKEKFPGGARAFLNTLAELQMESGYPYILFEDAANRANQLPGKIIMSNLCSEILQPQTPSVINDDQTYSELGKDISCNLASLNVLKVLESPDFGKTIETSIRMLSTVSNLSNIEAVPTVRKANEENRSIGLGAMNLHGAFAHHHMYYGDKESLDLTNIYFLLVTYHAIRTSMLLAKETGSSFKDFKNSKYYSGEYFARYINPENTHLYTPKTEKVKNIFANTHIPTAEDWEALAKKVKKYGMYNSHLQAVAPTGSISYLAFATSSIHPVTANYLEARKEGKMGTVYMPTPYAEGNEEFFGEGQSMYGIDSKKVIDIYSVVLHYVDQGASLTLGYKSSASTRDIVKNIMYAQSKGKPSSKELDERGKLLAEFGQAEIKTMYYSRILNEDLTEVNNMAECVSCAI